MNRLIAGISIVALFIGLLHILLDYGHAVGFPFYIAKSSEVATKTIYLPASTPTAISTPSATFAPTKSLNRTASPTSRFVPPSVTISK